MGWLLRIAAVGIMIAVLGGATLQWGAMRYTAPGPASAPVTVLIPKGTGIERIAIELGESGVISSPLVFAASAVFTGRTHDLKAGEYAFPTGISMEGVLLQMVQGRTVIHRLTVPEGWTSAQAVAAVKAEQALVGAVETEPENGALLPDTYHFSRGDSRQGLLDRMRAAMEQAVAEAWKDRAPGVLLASPRDAVTLASIVEKETGLAAERPRIAGVFLNRLAAGMKLQSDPTVVFALTKGESELGRPLTRADWQFSSPYNTYQINGLPPGPIANPGRAALRAVLAPEHNDYLYFVADGSGGHAFSANLADHNRNVAKRRAGSQGSNEAGSNASAEQ